MGFNICPLSHFLFVSLSWLPVVLFLLLILCRLRKKPKKMFLVLFIVFLLLLVIPRRNAFFGLLTAFLGLIYLEVTSLSVWIIIILFLVFLCFLILKKSVKFLIIFLIIFSLLTIITKIRLFNCHSSFSGEYHCHSIDVPCHAH